MYYLVYVSSASTLYTEADILQILQTSRKNNAALNITGMMLYYEGNIIQVLEGEEQQVKQVFETIKKDSRHKNLIEMAEGPLLERNFPDWSMGIQKLSKAEYAQIEGINQPDNSAMLNQGMAGQEHLALKLLKKFHQDNRHN